MRFLAALVFASVAFAAAPVLTELEPRGAQKGRPFTLTVVGTNLGEGASIISTLPANFTALGPVKPEMAGKSATFLVEPTGPWAVGVYPVRIKAENGISNILLFSVGAFPEIMEEESRPGALPHQNDSIERAQTIPSTPLTLNGQLRGPERDVYRLQVKAGERRVFEVDARRCGSAIDPVIRILDGSGKLIARSDDDPLLSLDARLTVTFPKDGYYYLEIHDARFSAQTQNFYRLRTGNYPYAQDIFPLGGHKGEQVEVSLSGTKVTANLNGVGTPQIFLNLPESPSLPLPFAVGEYAEAREPVTAPLQLPVTVNGRLDKPAEVDKYDLAVKPGDEFIVALQARELGTSKLTGLITVYDENGKKLASAGDGPLPVDVAAVQVSSRTLGDPYLHFKVPEGVQRVIVAVEDLARRGGVHYGYRLTAYRAPYDFRAVITTPFVNIPAGGTALVNVSVERQGYTGPIQIETVDPPKGLSIAGGNIPAEVPDPNNRAMSRRAMLSLTADANTTIDASQIRLRAVGKNEKGEEIRRPVAGLGYAIGVNGATAQGVVDRQRPLTGPWLGYDLPAAITDPTPATLALTLEKPEKKGEGYEFHFRWKWNVRDSMQRVPETVSADVPNFTDLRIIKMAVDEKDKTTGTFVVTSSKNTLPALYNIIISGRLMIDGSPQEVYSPIMAFSVPAMDSEEKPANAPASAAR